jgi:tetratricopeptide (TPR) repeat protein
MSKTPTLLCIAVMSCSPAMFAQTPTKVAAPAAVGVDHAITSASHGECSTALPVLQRELPRTTDKDLRYRGYMAAVRCAMGTQDDATTAKDLAQLKHDFPDDPEVLFVATHYYSQMANRASQELLAKAPNSPQVKRLQAESYESQQKWDEAIGEYNKILADNPKVAGVHYRIGQAILAKPDGASNAEQAQQEFKQELAIDPSNASAEFMLGELARRGQHWEDAIAHFSKASKLDVGFAEAYLALGMSLAGAARFPDAIEPLKHYIKIVPDDPAGHYQLAMVYLRTGDKEAATREMTLQRQLAAKAH